jgi:7-carboxy-7-deazaguanine synthase
MDYNKIQPICELYGPVIQSEGSLAGIPHIVVRTTGCTHRCWFGEGGWCDSFYTSIHPEKGKFTLNDLKAYFEQYSWCNHLMFTGGSPTMHPELCDEIVTMFKDFHNSHIQFYGPKGEETVKGFLNGGPGIITIETEGSHFIKTKYPIDLISLSPKFTNSIPKLGIEKPLGGIVDDRFIKQHNKFRLNKEAIKQMIEYHTNYHFKPVCNPIEMPEVWAEIEAFRVEMNIPKNKTWIMPPGDTAEEIIRVLPMVIDFCGQNGYNFSGRDHIIAFGQKRCV